MAADRPARVAPGIVASVDPLLVNIDGVRIPAFWPAGYIPRRGDRVRVRVEGGTSDVLGPIVTERRPVTGTVSGAPSSGRVPVNTSSGTKSCRYVGADPSIGDLVRLDWQSTDPWIWPSTAVVEPEPDPEEDPDPAPDPRPEPKPPPPPPQTGVATFSAVDAGRYRTGYGRWDMDEVHQGYWSYSGNNSNGAWFFGSAPGRLQGRTVTKFEIYVPRRLRIGSYNSAVSARFFRHTSNRRPSGDVNRVAGPQSRSIRAGWSGGWITLPDSWGQAIVNNGGGIGISGGSYLGFAITGGARLRIHWRR